MKHPPAFATEADLCASFLAWSKRFAGWTAYAETAGWDILMAHADGTQIGIQAKLRLNIKVIAQAIEEKWAISSPGPDFRAVLVPGNDGYSSICAALGLTVITADNYWGAKVDTFSPDLGSHSWQEWFYANPKKRHELPEYIPDVVAGSPAPMQLTRWKIGALKIAALIELRGHVTRTDFQEVGIDHRRWVQAWLEAVPGSPGAWRFLPEGGGDFRAQHPTVYPQVLADVRKALAARGDLVEQAQV